jgi:hypothetical protein
MEKVWYFIFNGINVSTWKLLLKSNLIIDGLQMDPYYFCTSATIRAFCTCWKKTNEYKYPLEPIVGTKFTYLMSFDNEIILCKPYKDPNTSIGNEKKLYLTWNLDSEALGSHNRQNRRANLNKKRLSPFFIIYLLIDFFFNKYKIAVSFKMSDIWSKF